MPSTNESAPKTPLRRTRESAPGSPTQAEVAAAVGVTQSYLHRVEVGQEQPSPSVAERIARFFGPPLTEEQILYPHRFMQEVAR